MIAIAGRAGTEGPGCRRGVARPDLREDRTPQSHAGAALHAQSVRFASASHDLKISAAVPRMISCLPPRVAQEELKQLEKLRGVKKVVVDSDGEEKEEEDDSGDGSEDETRCAKALRRGPRSRFCPSVRFSSHRGAADL